MADDFRPYRPRIGDRVSQQEPLIPGRLARLWELPIAFEFDDWVHFQFNFNPYRNGTSAPSKVLAIWSVEVDWMHTNVEGGLLTVAMHPQVIGRGRRIAMLPQFIAHCRQYDDLTFARLDDVVARLGPPDVAVAAPAGYIKEALQDLAGLSFNNVRYEWREGRKQRHGAYLRRLRCVKARLPNDA